MPCDAVAVATALVVYDLEQELSTPEGVQRMLTWLRQNGFPALSHNAMSFIEVFKDRVIIGEGWYSERDLQRAGITDQFKLAAAIDRYANMLSQRDIVRIIIAAGASVSNPQQGANGALAFRCVLRGTRMRIIIHRGKCTAIVEEGTFVEGKKVIEGLFASLKASGLEIEFSGEFEQHAHDTVLVDGRISVNATPFEDGSHSH